jgi:hypothetical protein
MIPRVGFQEKRANKTDQQDGRKYARAEYKMLIITSWPISGTSANSGFPGKFTYTRSFLAQTLLEPFLKPAKPSPEPIGASHVTHRTRPVTTEPLIALVAVD